MDQCLFSSPVSSTRSSFGMRFNGNHHGHLKEQEENAESDQYHDKVSLESSSSTASSEIIDCVPIEFVDEKITLKHLEDYLAGLVSDLENELSTLPDLRDLSESNKTVNNTSTSENSSPTFVNDIPAPSCLSLSLQSPSISSPTDESLIPKERFDSTGNGHAEGDSVNCSSSSLTKHSSTHPESPISFLTTISSATNCSQSSFYDLRNDEVDYNSLTAYQIQRILDRYKPVLRAHRKDHSGSTSFSLTSSSPSSNQLFGLDVNSIEKLNGGLSLPPFIEEALLYLTRNGINAMGIFRKSGVKSRITALRKKLEHINSTRKNGPTLSTHFSNLSSPVSSPLKSSTFQNPGEDFCVYDVADMVKMWLRTIKPRPLINKEIIEAYKSMTCDQCSPSEFGLKISVLLTDSQRTLLEIFIHFLAKFAENSQMNQMNSRNLALCFTPSLCECDYFDDVFNEFTKKRTLKKSSSTGSANISFQPNFNGIGSTNGFHSSNGVNSSSSSTTSSSSSTSSTNHSQILNQPTEYRSNPDRKLSNLNTDARAIFDAQKCLQYLIDNPSILNSFSISSFPFLISSSSESTTIDGENFHPPDDQISSPLRRSMDSIADYKRFGSISSLKTDNETCRFRSTDSVRRATLTNGSLLPSIHESSVIVNASPNDILRRILYQRSLFDPTIVEWRIIEERPEENVDIFEYKTQSSKFLSTKTFVIERKWTHVESVPIIENQSHASCFSLKKAKTKSFTGIILHETGYLHDSRWKIGSYGKGRSQLELSLVVDLRGHSFHWYTNTFPTIIDWQLNKIKQSFLIDFIEAKHHKVSQV